MRSRYIGTVSLATTSDGSPTFGPGPSGRGGPRWAREGLGGAHLKAKPEGRRRARAPDLQVDEAAASRQGGLADSELALKKLSARSSELPLALEAAKMSEEIKLELEKEDIE